MQPGRFGVPLMRASSSTASALLDRVAALDLADDRIDRAFEHLAAARALRVPEMFADILRADPELTALHGDPRWRGLLGE